jgi:hypothetical protein
LADKVAWDPFPFAVDHPWRAGGSIIASPYSADLRPEEIQQLLASVNGGLSKSVCRIYRIDIPGTSDRWIADVSPNQHQSHE